MQTSVHIEKCTPMFAWAAIGSIKHRYTLKNVNRFLRFENIEKTTFYLIQWEYPNSGSVISEIWPSCFEMGVNVTPPACGRRGTLTPHFSAYRAIFSDMSSPESGYCSNINRKTHTSNFGTPQFCSHLSYKDAWYLICLSQSSTICSLPSKGSDSNFELCYVCSK